MFRNNDASQTRPQPDSRAHRELEIPMVSFWESLKAILSGSRRGNMSQEGKIGDFTNILLLELLRKQKEQIQC